MQKRVEKVAILNAIASHKEQLSQNISAKERVFHNEQILKYEKKLKSLKNGGKLPKVKDLKKMFEDINADIIKNETGESVVPLTDSEYYAEQIQNIYDVDDKTADTLAKQLSSASAKGRMKKQK